MGVRGLLFLALFPPYPFACSMFPKHTKALKTLNNATIHIQLTNIKPYVRYTVSLIKQ